MGAVKGSQGAQLHRSHIAMPPEHANWKLTNFINRNKNEKYNKRDFWLKARVTQ